MSHIYHKSLNNFGDKEMSFDLVLICTIIVSIILLIVIAVYEKWTAKMKNKKRLQELAEQANTEDIFSEWESKYRILPSKKWVSGENKISCSLLIFIFLFHILFTRNSWVAMVWIFIVFTCERSSLHVR